MKIAETGKNGHKHCMARSDDDTNNSDTLTVVVKVMICVRHEHDKEQNVHEYARHLKCKELQEKRQPSV